MSDRVAVFNDGGIEQVGTPTEVYERPATPFVAGFVGTSNLLPVRPRASSSARTARSASGRRRSAGPGEAPRGRPDGEVGAAGEVSEVVYAGPSTRFVVRLDAGPELVALQQNTGPASGRPAAPARQPGPAGLGGGRTSTACPGRRPKRKGN